MKGIIVVLKDGTETTLENWQKLYGLKVGSDKIGKYFGLNDPKLAQDLKDYGKLVVNEQLIRVLDAFREKIGRAVKINAFNRDEHKQEQLIEAGYRAALCSPHVAKMAADIDTASPQETLEWVKQLKLVADEIGIKIRIGFKDYLNHGQTFIHIDVCPEYYAAGKPFHKQTHPQVWELTTYW